MNDHAERPPALDVTVLEGMFTDRATVVRHLRRFIPRQHDELTTLAALVDRGDLAAVEQQLHRIRSAALMVGARELAALAADAERHASDGDAIASAATVAQLPAALGRLAAAVDRYTSPTARS